jgi:hypothetical protein
MKRRAFVSTLFVLSAISLVLLRSDRSASPGFSVLDSSPVLLGGRLGESLLLQDDRLAARDIAKHYRSVASYGELPLSFEINRGQTDPQVRFLTRGRGYALFLTGDGAVLSLDKKGREQTLTTDVVRMRLMGANAHAEVVGLQELPGKANYFIGRDPQKWRTNVATFAKVKYKNVYPGVDLVYYGNRAQLEYDFVVAPGADPNVIALIVDASVPYRREQADIRPVLQIAANGDLVFAADSGEIRFHKPLVYQPTDSSSSDAKSELGVRNSKVLDGHYELTTENRVHFEVAGYDKSRSLVIDPVLTYSSYLGGSGSDGATAISVDSSGNAYVTGSTYSTNFPTVGPIKATNTGVQEAFVAKVNAAGNALVYSTYLGGSGGDLGTGIAVDATGNAYVTGNTCSADFPTTAGSFEPTFRGPACTNGSGDAFVAKLDAGGNALSYATYLGGTGTDSGSAIAVDSSGNAYVVGSTQSTDFPTQNPLQTANKGNGDAFVTELNSSGSALVYSTYLGGSFLDQAFGIAVDSSGNAYVTGWTDSGDFPTANAFQTGNGASYEGNYDVFVSKLNATGNALVYSTYLVGDYDDAGYGIAIDPSGEAFVTGSTGSDNFPVTPGAYQTSLSNSTSFPYYPNAFVTKLTATGNSLVYSSYLGGYYGTGAYGIALDSSGNAHITGYTSGGLPQVNGFPEPQGTTYGNMGFVTKFSSTGSSLVYSGYLTGHNGAGGSAIAVDASGNAYVTGGTQSTDFPTVNPFQTASGGNGDAFVAKLGPANASAVSLAPSPLNFLGQVVNTTSSSQTLVLQNVGSSTLNISNTSISGANSGDFAIAVSTCGATVFSFNTCNLPITFTPSASGSRTASLSISDDAAGSPQTVSLNGTGEDFGVAVASGTSSSATVNAGGTATYTLSVSPLGGFNKTVSLSCTGAPSQSACTPSSPSVTLDGTNSQNVTVKVTTMARAMLSPVTGPSDWPRTLPLLLLMCVSALLVMLDLLRRKRARPQVGFALLIFCVVSLASMAACGGGGSSSVSGTPSGTYTLTVTGSDGSLTRTQKLTLTVQ